MVTRRVVGGVNTVPSPHLHLPVVPVPVVPVPVALLSTAVALLLAFALPAQQPAPASESAPAKTTQDPRPSVPAVEAAAETPVYGKIVVAEARLRCWSGTVAEPPVFEDVLKQDQIVQLGRSENGFRSVLLPLGPIGYVSKRYTTQADDGTVTTSRPLISFRYRPRTTEAPVGQLPEGTKLHVIGEEEEWFKARVAGIDAWLPAAEVQVVDAGEDVAAAYQAFVEATKGEAQARLDAIAAEQKRLEQNRIDLEAVQVVEVAFAQELQKPDAEQQLAPLTAALDKLASTLAKESEVHTAIAALKKRIETRQWIAEAIAVRNSEPPVDDQPQPVPPPTDSLERFESIGWLRYESRLAGPGVYYLEKGGRRQHLLSCNTGRYDLALFVGREVGVIGPRRTPSSQSMSILDVERLEVLGSLQR